MWTGTWSNLLQIAAWSHVGGRQNNEDSTYVGRATPIFAVADGLGGHADGEVASTLAVTHVSGHAAEPLNEVVLGAHRAVKLEQRRRGNNMASTLTVGRINLDTGMLELAHVGDSRCLLLRGGVVQQLTLDQTIAEALFRDGRITAEQRPYALQNLTDCVGQSTGDPKPQLHCTLLCSGDVLLFLTDGAYNYVPPETMLALAADCIARREPAGIAKSIVDAALSAKTHDNATCISVFVRPIDF